jgi:hypothetical protein
MDERGINDPVKLVGVGVSEGAVIGPVLFTSPGIEANLERFRAAVEAEDALSWEAEAFGDKAVLVRTLDLGGDKDLPSVEQPYEENPFLEWRGIRMSLETPELFKPQLRAILRAGTTGNLTIMFPMVVDVEELRAAREFLDECRKELESEGAVAGPVEAGVMIETPAAICAADLVRGSLFLRRHQRPGPVHFSRRPGQQTPRTPAERRSPGGAEAHRQHLQGRPGSRHLGRSLRRGHRRARPDPEASKARRHQVEHERPVHPTGGRLGAVGIRAR